MFKTINRHTKKKGLEFRKAISQVKWGLSLELSACVCGEFEGPVLLEFNHWRLNFVSHPTLPFCQAVLPVSFPSVRHHTDEPVLIMLDPAGSVFFLASLGFFFVFAMGRKWRRAGDGYEFNEMDRVGGMDFDSFR